MIKKSPTLSFKTQSTVSQSKIYTFVRICIAHRPLSAVEYWVAEMYKWESCNNTILFGYSLEGNEVNRGGGQMINCQSSDDFQGEKSLPSNIEKETSRKSKQVERWDKQTVMQKIDATKQKMTTLAQLSIEEAVLASIVLICGNNYLKIKSLCEAVNLEVTHDSFLNFQRSCIAPVFEEVWSGMNDLVEKLLRNQEEICLCTAGTRNSINGCIARYCDSTL